VSRSDPINGFEINRAALSHVGEALQRPECSLAEPDGSLWTADAHGASCTTHPTVGAGSVAWGAIVALE